MNKDFNQKEWSTKIRKAAAELVEQNSEYFHPNLRQSGSAKITLPDDKDFIIYRVPMNIWYDYHDAKYNNKTTIYHE